MTTNKVEIRSEVKVLFPKCQTEGKKSKVIFYPGQTIPKMKYTWMARILKATPSI